MLQSANLNCFTRKLRVSILFCTSFVDHTCYLCLMFVMLSRLFVAALWSPSGKGLTCWLFFVIFNCGFVTFPCGILGQVWYLIVSIPDLCHLFLLWSLCVCAYAQANLRLCWSHYHIVGNLMHWLNYSKSPFDRVLFY